MKSKKYVHREIDSLRNTAGLEYHSIGSLGIRVFYKLLLLSGCGGCHITLEWSSCPLPGEEYSWNNEKRAVPECENLQFSYTLYGIAPK